jgi:Flp pilus assembly protein TadD
MLYLADAKIQMNQPEDALPLLEKLVKMSPPNAMAHRDLGIIYAGKDRYKDAEAEFKAAIRLAPSDVNAHWRLGRLYRSMGRAADAKVEFDKAKGLNKAEDDRLLKVMSTIPAGEHPSNPPPQK